MTRAAVLLGVAMLLVGCYNYEALGRSHLRPSSFVMITLTESGSEELARYLGPDVLTVDGRFLGADERGLLLSVTAVETRRGHVLDWQGESVVVPGAFVREVEERHPAFTKTALLAGASLVGFFAAYQAFGPGPSTSTTASGPGGGSPGAH
jgi:hypothetical protein